MAGKSVNANRINSNDPVQRAQYYKVYYQNNRERILQYYQDNKEEFKVKQAEYYQTHKEGKKAQQKVYLAKKKAENELKLKTFDPNTSKHTICLRKT